MTSKRRSNKINLLSLSFVTKCVSKAFLIKILNFVKFNILPVERGLSFFEGLLDNLLFMSSSISCRTSFFSDEKPHKYCKILQKQFCFVPPLRFCVTMATRATTGTQSDTTRLLSSGNTVTSIFEKRYEH